MDYHVRVPGLVNWRLQVGIPKPAGTICVGKFVGVAKASFNCSGARNVVQILMKGTDLPNAQQQRIVAPCKNHCLLMKLHFDL